MENKPFQYELSTIDNTTTVTEYDCSTCCYLGSSLCLNCNDTEGSDSPSNASNSDGNTNVPTEALQSVTEPVGGATRPIGTGTNVGGVTILDITGSPLTKIGQAAGLCYGTKDSSKYRGIAIDCYNSGHGRALEFADVTLCIEGYSAKVFRELYTHVSGTSRLQASTRYINYQEFEYVTPVSVWNNHLADNIYDDVMSTVAEGIDNLQKLGIPKEDASMLLPLAYETKVILKINVRALIHMAEIRLCTRAFHEFRHLMSAIKALLHNLGGEWQEISKWLLAKCQKTGYCVEKVSCGMKPKQPTVAEE